jgi:Flp pilus assembly CpaF family ATPase
VSGATGTGKTTLLNVLERHLFSSRELAKRLCAMYHQPAAQHCPGCGQ